MATQKESPIFGKTYDFLRWFVPVTLNFPKSQRFVLAQRLQQTALDFYDLIVQAGRGVKVWPSLRQADVELERLRLAIRLCKDLELLGPRQYRQAAGRVDEIGRLLGGWLKTLKPPAQGAAGGQQELPLWQDGRPGRPSVGTGRRGGARGLVEQ